MTPEQPAAHRQRTSSRRVAWTFSIIGVAGCVAGVGNLYHVQGEQQDCLTRFLSSESQARQVRTDASAMSAQAQRKAFDSAAKLLTKPSPSQQDIIDVRDSLQAYGKAADQYNDAVSDFPYKDFKKECRS